MIPGQGFVVDSKICSHQRALADLIWGATPQRFPKCSGMGLSPSVASNKDEGKQESGKQRKQCWQSSRQFPEKRRTNYDSDREEQQGKRTASFNKPSMRQSVTVERLACKWPPM